VLVGNVGILAFATIDLVSLAVCPGRDVIVAIPTIENVLARQILKPIIAAAPIDDVIALLAT
jgi:hypothetical protein